MFEALLVAALITLSDPVGDAVGNGSLVPPSAEVYRNLAPFDLRQVVVTDDPQLTLRIEMGSLSDPFDLPMGFSLPVIEVYVSGQEGGRNELLSGSGMRLPQGQGWEVAVRLTGEQATAYRASSAPGGVETAPATVTTMGNELLVTTSYPRPDRPRVYAITGLYDLFGATPWRPLELQESPFAFSSEAQRLPVIDVLAQGESRQAQAIDAGILPPARNRSPIPGAFWLVLMAAGMLVTLAGVAMRMLARPPGAAVEEEDVPETTAAGPVTWESQPTPVAQPAESERRQFTWDSSALLTEPEDEELDEELESEFGEARDSGASAYQESGDAWQRPVPLPFRRSMGSEPVQPEGGAEPEMVRDEAEDAAGTSDSGEIAEESAAAAETDAESLEADEADEAVVGEAEAEEPDEDEVVTESDPGDTADADDDEPAEDDSTEVEPDERA